MFRAWSFDLGQGVGTHLVDRFARELRHSHVLVVADVPRILLAIKAGFGGCRVKAIAVQMVQRGAIFASRFLGRGHHEARLFIRGELSCCIVSHQSLFDLLGTKLGRCSLRVEPV